MADPLPSWRETPAKQSIVEFVAAVTRPGSPDFVPGPERVAVFDNDGTLWTEQPVYAQLVFALDRAAQLAQRLRAARAGPCSWSSTTRTAIASTPTTMTRSWAPARTGFARPPPTRSGP